MIRHIGIGALSGLGRAGKSSTFPSPLKAFCASLHATHCNGQIASCPIRCVLTRIDTRRSVSPMKTFRDVINSFGNAEQMGRDLGVPGLSVRQWRRRNSIPAQHWTRIVDLAHARGLDIISIELLATIAASSASSTARTA